MEVFISDCHFAGCNVGIQQGTNGTNTTWLQVSVDRTTIAQMSGNGIEVFSGKMAVSNSVITQNSLGAGAIVIDAEMDLFNNQFNLNDIGVEVGTTSVVRLAGNDFTLNNVDIQCASTLVLDYGNILVGTENGCTSYSAASTLLPSSFFHSLLDFFFAMM